MSFRNTFKSPSGQPSFWKALLVFTLLVGSATVYFMHHLSYPRNMNLRSFEPHRQGFECKREADVVPPIDPQANEWFLEANAAISWDLDKAERDYVKAFELTKKAAERRHWKAMINLATAYAYGEGTDRDSELAVQTLEEAMKLGIPAAFDLMGTYHLEGLGVKQDASRAYAFWQLAAEMGSASAQSAIGEKLKGLYSNPERGFWGNRPVGVAMLECAYSQQDQKAAYQLGIMLSSDTGIDGKPDHPRALRAFHDGVKWGCIECAGWLSISFHGNEAMTGFLVDKAREERYDVLERALRYNHDLRLPNLDKVLPLPPAALPQWDGNPQTLVNAAKAVVPLLPPAPPHPGTQRSGRAHVPAGHTLGEPRYALQGHRNYARDAGYWQPRLSPELSFGSAEFVNGIVPQRYEPGEALESSAAMSRPTRSTPWHFLSREQYEGLMWQYLGEAVPIPVAATPTRVRHGLARSVTLASYFVCHGLRPCPATGIWWGKVAPEHPQAASFNGWSRQAYLEENAAFPDPRQQGLEIEPQEVQWGYLGEANALGQNGILQVPGG